MQFGSYNPKEGTIRYHKKFAWTPVKFENGITTWLECYINREIFLRGVWCYKSSKIKFTK